MNGIKIYRRNELTLKSDVPGARKWFVALEKSMLSYFELDPNTQFPEHSHESEQITMVLEGELAFRFDGKTVVLRSGEVIAIPSNAVHSVSTNHMSCKAIDAWSPVRKDFIYSLRKASPDDMSSIERYIEGFRLDNEDMDYCQFVVVTEDDEIVGFGRIRPHKDIYELGSIGVVENKRNQGIGKMIVKHLIDIFPVEYVYITTDNSAYFERFGFRKADSGPKELFEKISRVCKSKCREGAIVMIYDKSALGN